MNKLEEGSIFKSRRPLVIVDEVECIQNIDEFNLVKGKLSKSWYWPEDIIKIKKPKQKLSVMATVDISLESLLRRADEDVRKHFYEHALVIAIFKRKLKYFGYDEKKSKLIYATFAIRYPYNSDPFIYCYRSNNWMYRTRKNIILSLDGKHFKSGVNKEFSTLVEKICIDYFGAM